MHSCYITIPLKPHSQLTKIASHDNLHGTTITYQDGFTVYNLREPHGVCGIIIPWNYSMQILGRAPENDFYVVARKGQKLGAKAQAVWDWLISSSPRT